MATVTRLINSLGGSIAIEVGRCLQDDSEGPLRLLSQDSHPGSAPVDIELVLGQSLVFRHEDKWVKHATVTLQPGGNYATIIRTDLKWNPPATSIRRTYASTVAANCPSAGDSAVVTIFVERDLPTLWPNAIVGGNRIVQSVKGISSLGTVGSAISKLFGAGALTTATLIASVALLILVFGTLLIAILRDTCIRHIAQEATSGG